MQDPSELTYRIGELRRSAVVLRGVFPWASHKTELARVLGLVFDLDIEHACRVRRVPLIGAVVIGQRGMHLAEVIISAAAAQ